MTANCCTGLLLAADDWRAGVSLGELRLSVDIRAGISEWRTPRVSAQDLLRQADVALLQAKEQSTVAVVYEPAHDADHRRRVMLVAELRRALASDGLALHYQPLVNMTNRTVLSFEALLRWNHPALGNISPAEFIPLAERASVLPDLSRWVLNEAIGQLGAWQREGLDFSVAVNLSAADFTDGGLPAARVRAVERTPGSGYALAARGHGERDHARAAAGRADHAATAHRRSALCDR